LGGVSDENRAEIIITVSDMLRRHHAIGTSIVRGILTIILVVPSG
jgi:hypothetical protein